MRDSDGPYAKAQLDIAPFLAKAKLNTGSTYAFHHQLTIQYVAKSSRSFDNLLFATV